jgi:L-alanine-DL-glutamate epimerase-like enolase superfamily enzyme
MDAGLDVLQPDLSRCGGFTVARRVAYEAEDRNVMVCPHAWGSQILTAATLQFLGFLSQESMLEFNTSSDPVSRNLLAEPLVVSNGRVALPTGPGLGIEVDMEAINRLAGVHLD